jgi:hypothetical protein
MISGEAAGAGEEENQVSILITHEQYQQVE